MLRYALENLAAIWGRTYCPRERTVCLWSWNLRLVFVLAPASALAAWAWLQWAVFAGLPPWLVWPWLAYAVWGAGWLGGFAWADLGPAQWFAKRCLGTAYNPNVINTTLEGWEGPKELNELVAAWLAHRNERLRPWDGDPGSGRFGTE